MLVPFGGTPKDVTTRTAPATVWTAPTGGRKVTMLIVNAARVDKIPVIAGHIPAFKADVPDGTTEVWLSFGSGSRQSVHIASTQERIEWLEATVLQLLDLPAIKKLL